MATHKPAGRNSAKPSRQGFAEPRILDFATVAKPPPVEWLVKDLLARCAGTILAGEPGATKTRHAVCIVADLIKQGKRVLYLDFDGGLRLSHPLLTAALEGVGISGIPHNLLYYFSPSEEECSNGTGTLPTTLEDLEDFLFWMVQDNDIDLVVVDSIGQATDGNMSVDADVHAVLAKVLNPIKSLNAAILVLDHTPKRAAERGSTAPMGSQQKRAWARVVVTISPKANGYIQWTLDKTNLTKRWDPYHTRLEFQEDADGNVTVLKLHGLGTGVSLPSQVKALENATDRILALLENGPKSRSELCGSDSTKSRALNVLVEKKRVIKGEGHRAKYELCAISLDAV